VNENWQFGTDINNSPKCSSVLFKNRFYMNLDFISKTYSLGQFCVLKHEILITRGSASQISATRYEIWQKKTEKHF
jgi:hypothetical protein